MQLSSNTSFTGTYSHTIDSKGRLSIPSEFREILKNKYTEEIQLFKSPINRCIVAYPMSEWEIFQSRLDKLSKYNPQEWKIRAFILSSTRPCIIDKAGRILIPTDLRNYSGLDKDVILWGDITSFEIWNTERWNKVYDDTRENPDVADFIGEIFAKKGL